MLNKHLIVTAATAGLFALAPAPLRAADEDATPTAEVAKSESTYESDGTEIRNVSWSTDDGSVFVTVSDCISIETGEFDGACVTIYEQS